MVPHLLSSFLPPLLTFFELANSQSLHGFLLVFEGKERGDLDPHFHQSLSPLCEGNPLDLDLGVLGVLLLVLPLIFLPSISCFGGIWERRTWALRVPLPLHLVHRFEFSTVIRGSYKLRSAYYSWVLGTLELVPLGCLGALDGWWCSKLNHCGVKLQACVRVSN